MQTKINFILPFKARRPAGGFRVMYEYANRLALKGYQVHLTYPIKTKYMEYRLPYSARRILSVLEGFRRDNWFCFHPSITMEYVPEIIDKHVADADIVIATWWSTAMDMGKLSHLKGQKINLIQGYENWTGHEDELFESYNMPHTTNIVVASYLQDLVSKHSKNPTRLIYNAIDADIFHITQSIEDRKPASVVMTYSHQDIKGSKYGLEALLKVKEKHQDLTADFFGVAPAPEGLPDWITFHRSPDNLPEMYNSNAIFISNSLTEGFPLTPAEAMFCGCATICTAIDGHKEYCIDQENALLVEVKNIDQMSTSICDLIENKQKRLNLAHNGNDHIQQFRWSNAVQQMEEVIVSLSKNKQML